MNLTALKREVAVFCTSLGELSTPIPAAKWDQGVEVEHRVYTQLLHVLWIGLTFQ